MKLAVIGGGWAGLAAAVTAAQAGHQVTVFEAARTLGGRARRLPVTLPDGRELGLDNGQHILIGAYTESLRLMRRVGVDPDLALLRLPLSLRFPDGSGLALPPGRAPWDALAGILRAQGWHWRDRLSLLRAAIGWQLGGFTCAPQITVAELCAPLTHRLLDSFIEPLCVSALNTPAADASGVVFLRVLHDAMFGSPGSSNLLLPQVDLGAVFPQAAADWLRQQGHAVQLGHRVRHLTHEAHGAAGRWLSDGEPFDRVILATSAPDAAHASVEWSHHATEPIASSLRNWAAVAQALRHEAITTVYALAPGGLPGPMLALPAGDGRPAQFVFDRGQLGGPLGLLAFVISASTGDREPLQAQVVAQAREQLGLAIRPLRTITERRATFACTPGLRRPAGVIAPGLLACGDYIDGPYPATLEGAVRSGVAAGSLP